MANQSTDSLVQSATCLNSCIPDGAKMAVLIYLFAKIAGVSTTNTDALVQAAACLNNCIPPGMQLAVLVYLATQIVSGGGGGGAGTTVVTVNPSTAATQGSLQFNKTNNSLWINEDGTAGGWVQLI
jgi:hypothetical protein